MSKKSGKYAVFSIGFVGFAGDVMPKLRAQIFDCWLPDSGYKQTDDYDVEAYFLYPKDEKHKRHYGNMGSNRMIYVIPFWVIQSDIFVCGIITKCSQKCMRILVAFLQYLVRLFRNVEYCKTESKNVILIIN